MILLVHCFPPPPPLYTVLSPHPSPYPVWTIFLENIRRRQTCVTVKPERKVTTESIAGHSHWPLCVPTCLPVSLLGKDRDTERSHEFSGSSEN